MDGRSLHPLEPLVPAEIQKTIEQLKPNIAKLNAKDGEVKFVQIRLKDPSKQAVFAWERSKGAKRVDRLTLAIVFNRVRNETWEGLVNLSTGRVLSWKHIPGVQPSFVSEEYAAAQELVTQDPNVIAALKKYGVTDMSLVDVDLWTVGHFSPEDDPTHRLCRPLLHIRSTATSNTYARPCDGVFPVVDMNLMKVVRVEDSGRMLLPPAHDRFENYNGEPSPPASPSTPASSSSSSTAASMTAAGARYRQQLKPIRIAQPEGGSFVVTGHHVRWLDWEFRLGWTAREGMVLYQVGVHDPLRHDTLRSIAYRISFCEMVVPYGDPGKMNFRKNAFDAGEDGLGNNANSLTLGCDCVGYIHYFDAHMVNPEGQVVTTSRAICMHEEDFGLLWKHTDWRNGQAHTRRQRRLVLSFVATVANYDYAFVVYLYQHGGIEFEAKLTGILSTSPTAPNELPKHGTLVAPQLNGPIHQHFFNVRLDMNVDCADRDTPSNSVYELNFKTAPPDKTSNPYNNCFYGEFTRLDTESKAVRDYDSPGRSWLVRNDRALNRLGQPAAYRLIPQGNVKLLTHPSASINTRASFLKHHLWVTRFDERENYPAGDYPNQRKASDGLADWTQQNRSLRDTNVVLWYTFGETHLPKPEDWPIMNVVRAGFRLEPFGFFDANPTICLPPANPTAEAAFSVEASAGVSGACAPAATAASNMCGGSSQCGSGVGGACAKGSTALPSKL